METFPDETPVTTIHMMLWYQKCRIELAVTHLAQLPAEKWPATWYQNLSMESVRLLHHTFIWEF
jgi:hypothetical protein